MRLRSVVAWQNSSTLRTNSRGAVSVGTKSGPVALEEGVRVVPLMSAGLGTSIDILIRKPGRSVAPSANMSRNQPADDGGNTINKSHD